MALWVDLPSFVDDTVIERSDLQPVLDNLLVLKNRNYDHTLGFSSASGDQTTTSTTLVDVTIDKYTLNIDTEGGDLLVFVYMEARHSLNNSRVKLALKVDGEFHTPITTTFDDFLFTTQSGSFEYLMPNLTFIVPDLPPGSHVLSMAFGAGDPGVVTLSGVGRRKHMLVVELH